MKWTSLYLKMTELWLVTQFYWFSGGKKMLLFFCSKEKNVWLITSKYTDEENTYSIWHTCEPRAKTLLGEIILCFTTLHLLKSAENERQTRPFSWKTIWHVTVVKAMIVNNKSNNSFYLAASVSGSGCCTCWLTVNPYWDTWREQSSIKVISNICDFPTIKSLLLKCPFSVQLSKCEIIHF